MLTDAEYGEIMRQRNILVGSIEGAEGDEDNYDQLKKAAHDRKLEAEARLSLYTNFLSGAVEEYEKAHPPEEPE